MELGDFSWWLHDKSRGLVKLLKCSFCDSDQVQDEDIPFCSDCWAALEKGNLPKIDFKEYFSDGLEGRLKDVESLLSSMPENFFLWYLKGHLEHELGSTKKSLNSIKTSISYNEEYGDPWIRLGLIYSDMHKESEAIDHFRKGIEYTLQDPSNLVDAGVSLQASGQPKLASQILQKALELVPDEDRALVALGKVFVQMGDLESARKTLQKGIELYPHNEEVLRGMAQILLKLNDLEAAMDMYSRILDQHPRDFEALLAKGEIHLRKGELSHSIKAYKAVKDLDIHISWTGILKFIVSTLRSIMDGNENSLSYREDLKQEYENILLFLTELDEKVGTAQGPDPLSDIESLIKVMENQRLNLKDQVRQFEDLLIKYKVDDSFHQHLQTKVENLKDYLDKSRYFDGKQIALELSPFLTDLKTIETGAESKVKERLYQKLEELREIGMENKDLLIRMEMVDKLGEEGNTEGAAFMLKEIEVSLEEFWIDASKSYHENKMEELKTLLAEARNQFDTSGLTEIFRSFKDAYEKGPRNISEKYEDFMERYREDSASFYIKETARVLKEIDLKLKLIEKDGGKIKDLREEYEDIIDSEGEEKDQKARFEKVHGLLERIGYFEEQQQISKIRVRLRNLDTLLGEVDFLGMDEELARNVEPVRRVIERSLKQENHRLSEILTNELYENVEKILSENYRADIETLINNTEGEMLRLKGLGVEKKDWEVSIERSKKIMSGEEIGPMTEVINHLSRIQTGVQNFILETLPKNIDAKLETCKGKLKEGEDLGFPFSGENRQLKNLLKSASEISSLDILEDAYRFETELEKKIVRLLTKAIAELEEIIRSGIDVLTDMGGDRQSVMDILSMVNRADVLVDNGKHREAWDLMTGAQTLLEDLKQAAFLDIKDRRLKDIEKLTVVADDLQIDMKDLSKELSSILKKKKSDPEKDVKKVIYIHERLVESIKLGANDRFEVYKHGYDELLKKNMALLPENMPGEMRMQLKEAKAGLRSDQLEELPVLLKNTEELLDIAIKAATKKAYLERVSKILEAGMSIKDPKAKKIVKKSQDLAKKIEGGETERIDDELIELQQEIVSLRSLVQMQNIESKLLEVQKLDQLAVDVFDSIDDDRFKERIEEMTDRISNLLDQTTGLYKDPDPTVLEGLSDIINQLNSDIIEIEYEWRATKRLDILDGIDLKAEDIDENLIAEDIENLNKNFSEREWTRFFRTWERLEGHIRKMEQTGDLPGGSAKLIEEVPASPGVIILSRKMSKEIKDTKGADIKISSKESGISRLAKEMEKKKKLIEGKSKKRKVKVPKGKKGEIEGTSELTSIAKTIAGARIEKLKKSDSKALSDEVPLPDNTVGEMMEDILEIDTSVGKKDSSVEAEMVREKLKLFFEKFPMMGQLDEARSKFESGEKLLENDDKEGAVGEYREAMSIAIKIGKVHMDMNKALITVRETLNKLKKKGFESGSAEDLYNEGCMLLKEGDLLGCARNIKSIREELSKME